MSDDNIFELLRRAAGIHRKLATDWVKKRDLTPEQGMTLGYLVENPGTMQRDIAAANGTSAANVSGVLQVLQRRGLIERRTVPGDERSKRVYATPEAVELTSGFDEDMAAISEAVLAPLSSRERDQLQSLLLKIIENPSIDAPAG